MSSNVRTKSHRRKRPRIRVVIPKHQTGFKRAGDAFIEELLRVSKSIESAQGQRTFLTRIIKIQKGVSTLRN